MTILPRSTSLRYGVLILGIGAVGLATVFLFRISFLFRTETEVFSTAVMETSYRWGSPVRTDVTDHEHPSASFWIEHRRPKLLAVPYSIAGAEVPPRFINEPSWFYFDPDSDSHADIRVKASHHFQTIEILEDENGVWTKPPEGDLASLADWVYWAMYGDHSEPFFDHRAAKKELLLLIDSAIEDAGSEETQQILAQFAKYLKETKTASVSRKNLEFLERLSSDLENALKADVDGE